MMPDCNTRCTSSHLYFSSVVRHPTTANIRCPCFRSRSTGCAHPRLAPTRRHLTMTLVCFRCRGRLLPCPARCPAHAVHCPGSANLCRLFSKAGELLVEEAGDDLRVRYFLYIIRTEYSVMGVRFFSCFSYRAGSSPYQTFPPCTSYNNDQLW